MNNKLAGSEGGGWTQASYDKFHSPDYDTGMASYLVDTLQPTSVLEIGSGLGYVARHLNNASCCQEPVHCIEPNDNNGVYDSTTGPILYPFDLVNDERPEDLRRVYDLVLSIEMAEHVERESHTALFDFMVSCASKWIVFSGARVGQPGHGHIACRTEADWRSEFLGRGLFYQSEMTNTLRAMCNERNQNHKRNLQVFHKG